MPKKPRTYKRSWELSFRHNGWHSNCVNSHCPSPYSIPDSIYADDSKDWEPAGADYRAPRPGYIYAVRATSQSAGFTNRADKIYYSVVRRKAK